MPQSTSELRNRKYRASYRPLVDRWSVRCKLYTQQNASLGELKFQRLQLARVKTKGTWRSHLHLDYNLPGILQQLRNIVDMLDISTATTTKYAHMRNDFK